MPSQSRSTASPPPPTGSTASPLDAVEQALCELAAVGPDERLALRFVLSVIAANQDKDTDPTWGMLIAPPSSLKTEILSATRGGPVYFLSDLTPRTFASGAQTQDGSDPSLLPKLNGKTLVLKDFTTVLSMQRDRRGEILSQLREIYDGRFDKGFGNGKKVSWQGRVGLIAAVTEAVDQHQGAMSALGERFLYYRMRSSDRTAAARMALSMSTSGNPAREKLSGTITALLSSVNLQRVGGKPDSKTEEVLIALADLTTKARAAVIRERGSRHVTQTMSPEGPGRFVKQLWHLARGHAAIRGAAKVSAEDLALVRRVAADTIPPLRWALLELLARYPLGLRLGALDVGSLQKVSRSTRERVVQDLQHLELVSLSQDPECPEYLRASLTLDCEALWKRCHPPDAVEQQGRKRAKGGRGGR